jgi:hypothetical protein
MPYGELGHELVQAVPVQQLDLWLHENGENNTAESRQQMDPHCKNLGPGVC